MTFENVRAVLPSLADPRPCFGCFFQIITFWLFENHTSVLEQLMSLTDHCWKYFQYFLQNTFVCTVSVLVSRQNPIYKLFSMDRSSRNTLRTSSFNFVRRVTVQSKRLWTFISAEVLPRVAVYFFPLHSFIWRIDVYTLAVCYLSQRYVGPIDV